MGLMNRLVEYVRQRGECSMGEVEVQLGVPIWKQYVLARAYRDFFQDVRLERSRWRLTAIKEPVVVPLTAQDSLSLSLTQEKHPDSKLFSSVRRGCAAQNTISEKSYKQLDKLDIGGAAGGI